MKIVRDLVIVGAVLAIALVPMMVDAQRRCCSRRCELGHPGWIDPLSRRSDVDGKGEQDRADNDEHDTEMLTRHFPPRRSAIYDVEIPRGTLQDFDKNRCIRFGTA